MRKMVGAFASAMALAIFVGVALGYFGGLVFAFDALAHFRLHLALLILPVAAIALCVRNRPALWGLGAAALLAVAGLGALAEKPGARDDAGAAGPDAEARIITVMTANLYQHNETPEIMRAALLAEDPDILVTHETGRSATAGRTSLRRHYPYRLALMTEGQELRTVLWSRYPMRKGSLLLEDAVEPTGVRAIVEIGSGREIGLLGLHFAHTLGGNQQVQIEALGAIADALPPTRIVLGDLNLTPWSWGMLRTEALTATRRIVGYRVTWFGSYRTLAGRIRALVGQPIDHVLVSPDISVEEIRTTPIPGSDHLGVFARLRVPFG